jgi:WD40 repeat protein/tRNA A-37 threonylcarbamoyl transferase component Bud32
MQRTECLNPDELRAYVLGEMGDDLLDDVTAHLESCARCEAAVSAMDQLTDAFVSRLRAHVLSGTAEETPPKIDATTAALTGPGPAGPSAKSATFAGPMAGSSPPGYEILGVLGRGGMGIVYQARQRKINRIVALKMVLTGAFASAEERSRFRYEAELIGQMNHPHIVQIHEAGQHDGLPFFALEFVNGGNLAERLERDGAMQTREAAELVERLSRGMHHAHLLGIVHRDLKPSNILLETAPSPASDPAVSTGSPIPKITDFGLGASSAPWGMSQLTAAGAVMGTPAYMAPEQATGVRAGPLADIYALGGILYECLSGRPPYTGKTPMEVIAQRSLHDVSPLTPDRRKGRSIPPDLATICMKCLEKSPGRRYASAEALADDLARFLAGEPVKARPVGRLTRAAMWARRRPALAVLTAASLLLLVATFTLALVGRQTALQNADEQQKLRVGVQVVLDRNRRLTAGLAIDQGVSLCQKGDTANGLMALVRAVELAQEASDADLERVARLDLATWSSSYLRLRFTCKTTDWCCSAVFSPDEQSLLTADSGKAVQRWDATTGKPQGEPFPHRDPVWSVDFAADDLAISGSGSRSDKRGEIRVWNLRTREVLLSESLNASVVNVACNPRDRSSFLASCPDFAEVWSSQTLQRTGTPMRLAPAAEKSDLHFAGYSTDGALVALAGSTPKGGVVKLFDSATGVLKHTLPLFEKSVSELAFHPSGKWLATACEDGKAQVWNVETGEPVGAACIHVGPVYAVVFSPDGNTLATSSGVHIRSAGSKDGLAVGSAQTRIWHAETSLALTAPMHHPSPVQALAFSPDGRWLFTGSEDGKSRLFSTVTGEAVGNLMVGAGNVCSARFSRDGRCVLTAHNGNGARLWEMPAKGVGAMLPIRSRITSLEYSPNGDSLLAANAIGDAWIWETKERRLTSTYRHSEWIRHAAFDDEGDLIFVGTHTPFQRRERLTGEVRSQSPPDASLLDAVLSPNRRQVFAIGSKAGRWDVGRGQFTDLPIPAELKLKDAGWDGDSAVIISVHDPASQRQWIERRELLTGRLLMRYDAPEPCRFMDISPDRKFLLGYCFGSEQVRRWDLATGKLVGLPFGHESNTVNSARFSRDSGLILTCSEDATARLWDTATSKQVGPPFALRGSAYVSAFSPDGKEIAIGRANFVQIVDVPVPMPGTVGELRRHFQELTGLSADAGTIPDSRLR